LQRAFAEELSEPSAVYRVLDTTLVPAMVRVRASRKGLFCGQATFGRSASKTEWVYGFKVALVVNPEGVVSAFGLAPAASDERPIQRRSKRLNHRTVAAVLEVAAGVFGTESRDRAAHRLEKSFSATRLGFTHQAFDLAECLLDRVEIW
jgi:hypothetical protein